MSYNVPSSLNQDAYNDYIRNMNMNMGLNIANLGTGGSLGFLLGNIGGSVLGNYLYNRDQKRTEEARENALSLVSAVHDPNYLSKQLTPPSYFPNPNPYDFSKSVWDYKPNTNYNNPLVSASQNPNYLSDQLKYQTHTAPPSTQSGAFNFNKPANTPQYFPYPSQQNEYKFETPSSLSAYGKKPETYSILRYGG